MPTTSARKPANSVDPYATAAVIPSHLPAPRPSSEIAGVISATMISGMMKLRKFPNRPLNVTNARAAHTGKNNPQTMPRTMAMRMRGSSPIFFMGGHLVVSSSRAVRD